MLAHFPAQRESLTPLFRFFFRSNHSYQRMILTYFDSIRAGCPLVVSVQLRLGERQAACRVDAILRGPHTDMPVCSESFSKLLRAALSGDGIAVSDHEALEQL